MADGLPPEAIPPDKNYRCHPELVNKTVFCVLCDNVYHKSDFNRKKNVRYVTQVIVICDEHPTVDLTSIKSDDPRVLITILKNELKNMEKEIEKYKQNNKQISKDYLKLQTKYENLLKEKDQESMDYTINETECEQEKLSHILEENKILKELNTELKEKNNLLQELLHIEKEKPKTAAKTYAEVITNKIIQQPKLVPKIKINRRNKEDKTNIKQSVTHYITKNMNIKTKKIEYKSEDEIVVSCIDAENAKSAKKYLADKLSHIFKIEEEQLKKPIVKIIGIEKELCVDQKFLEDDINTRNFAHLQTKNKESL